VKDAGATAIAATRTSKKKKELLELGADYVIATEEEDLPARVKEITEARSAADLRSGGGTVCGEAGGSGAPAGSFMSMADCRCNRRPFRRGGDDEGD